MKTSNCQATACRHCRFYTPEGRRGGNCQQLGVLVRGGWKACSLALPPFAPSWESLEDELGAIKMVPVGDTVSLERAFNQPAALREETEVPIASKREKVTKPGNGEYFGSAR